MFNDCNIQSKTSQNAIPIMDGYDLKSRKTVIESLYFKHKSFKLFERIKKTLYIFFQRLGFQQ